MQVTIRHNPSFAVARITLAPGEPVQAEAGRGVAWLANEWSVTTDTKWGGFGNLVGGEGGFLMRATGQGQILVACSALWTSTGLGPGERVVLDSGHLVAYSDGIAVSTRRLGSTMTALKSGEGLVFEFTGPGQVLGQSRNPSASSPTWRPWGWGLSGPDLSMVSPELAVGCQ